MQPSKHISHLIEAHHLTPSWKVINNLKITDCEKRAKIINLANRKNKIKLDKQYDYYHGTKSNSMDGLQPGDKLPTKRHRRKSYTPLTKEQQALLIENYWVAETIAKKFVKTHPRLGSLTYDDILGECTLALSRAASEYRSGILGKNGKECKFSTYAHTRVKFACQNAIRDSGRIVKIPRSISKKRTDVRKLVEKGRTYEEIADALDITEYTVWECEQSWQENYYSTDFTGDREDDNDRPVYEIPAPDPFVSESSPQANDVVAALSDEDFKILDAYFNDDRVSTAIRKRGEELHKMILKKIEEKEAQAKDHERM